MSFRALLGSEQPKLLDRPGPNHHHGHGDHQHGDHQHGDGGHLPHVAVVNRPVAGHTVPSLVYPELVQGRYELCLKGTDDVLLTGGAVTTATWPT